MLILPLPFALCIILMYIELCLFIYINNSETRILLKKKLILEWKKVSEMINFRIFGLKGCLVLSFCLFHVFFFKSSVCIVNIFFHG